MEEERVIPDQRFPLALLVLVGLLGITLATQTVFLLESQEPDSENLSAEDANIEVAVGDGYFQQQDSDLPEDVLNAQVGDIIRFENTGEIPHTATLPEYGLDEHLNPGEEVYLEVDSASEDTLVDCTLHAHHEATLTVSE